MAVTSNQHLISDTDGLFEPSVADFWSLLKPRVMSLVIFTGFAGMYVAPDAMHPLVFVISLFAIAAGAGASGAINQWYDRDIDAVMTRTKMRPIPAGVMAPAEALTMGLVISALSVLLLGLAANWLAAGLLAFTIFFYAVVYTVWLKRSTPKISLSAELLARCRQSLAGPRLPAACQSNLCYFLPSSLCGTRRILRLWTLSRGFPSCFCLSQHVSPLLCRRGVQYGFRTNVFKKA